MDVLEHLTESIHALSTQFSTLARNLAGAAMIASQKKTTSAFQAVQPMLAFENEVPANADSPPLRSRIVADMRRSPILWVAIAYQVTCVVYSLIFGIIILATARMFVLTILLYARYLAQENTKLKTFEASNKDLKETNTNLNKVVEALRPLLQQASGTAENTKVTAENLASLIPLIEQFTTALNGNRTLWEEVKKALEQKARTEQLLANTNARVEEANRHLDLVRVRINHETGRLTSQVTASGQICENLTQLVRQLSNLTTPLEDATLREKIRAAISNADPSTPQVILVQS